MPTKYIANHEPLRLKEIIDLLEDAVKERNNPTSGNRITSHIQNILGRGIIGSTTPIDDKSAAGKARGELDRLYTEFLRDSGQSVDDLAITLYQLMNS